MANPGGVGAKFVSVNLNKSYGQSSHHNYQPYNSGSYGPSGNRARPGSHASAGGGGGGGMVVLSRNRPLQKVAPKLSVPPPLNLPSRRKEHEKQDPSGGAGGSAGGSGAGSGPRPSSSGMGWTKPGNVALQEKEGSGVSAVAEIVHDTNGVSKGGSTYMPPAARLAGGGLVHADAASASASAHSYSPAVEKAMVLRGEDFPSLKAALPISSGPSQKQKDTSSQKQKQLVIEESSVEQRDSSHMSSPLPMRPQGQSSHSITNSSSEKGGQSHKYGSAQAGNQSQKQEIPLPLVRLNPRSDWADDERDTGHVFVERNRDHGFPRSEAFWERDFDMPRSSILPHKPPKSTFERWSQRSDEAGKNSTNEVLKLDPYHRNVSTPNREDREGNSWRNSSLHKDGLSVQVVVNDRVDIGRQAGLGRDAVKDNKYTSTSFGDNARHGGLYGNRDSSYGKRDMGNGQHVGQHWNQPVESLSRGAERHTRDRYGVEQSNRYRDEASLNSTASKSSFSSGGKGLPMNDPLLNFGREKRAFSKNERPYVEDPYSKDFGSSGYDERDPFSASLVGLVKRKKDVVKPTDFHDPVRESFEAELERVQKMQEMERQRVIEEQERALELARREEEERRRLIREEEERRRRLEDEAREAAWRAEQERLDAIRKAEEQRIAREEEKRRIYYEEERRKQAAKQKLLELEAKIAQRQTEVTKSEPFANTAANDEITANRMEKDMSTAADLDNWEDSERMVERITTSASSDSTLNRSSFADRGKPGYPWRRDAFENESNSSFLIHEPENGHHSPRRDTFGGRAFPRREFYGGGGYMPSRTDFRGGMQESQPDGFAHHLREHRWNQSGDGDHYNKSRGIETDFYENVGEKYGDIGWAEGNSRGSTRPPYPDRLYSESDEIYSYGRSRYSMRQPRVLPPPSLTSVHKTSFRGENENSASSTSLENDGLYNHHAARAEPTLQTGYYGGRQEDLESSEPVDIRQEIVTQRLDNNATPRCDSQSSLSVSSAPSSPTHLSHDELDDSAGSPVVSTAVEGKETLLSGNISDVLNDKSENEMMKASNSIPADDDDEWSLENDQELQEQEEYDEDDDGYREEDEVHDRDDENIDLTQEFQHMNLEEKSSSDVMENLVLGFNEGVEVGIPGDELERNSNSEQNQYEMPEVSVMEEDKKSFERVKGDQCLQQVFHESERAIEGSNSQRLNASHTSTASDLLESTDASSGSGPSGTSPQCTVPCSVDLGSQSSGQTVLSSVSSAPTQADLPVKLQFGLFSGPSLIPSPVPAIQIGSIQMPLHLHPQVGSSISHIHQSQPPLFQFGQFRYTSPVSQGILPMAPQSMSFVQPNIHTHYNLNQNCGGTVPSQPAQDTSSLNMKKDDVPSFSVSNQPAMLSTVPAPSGENWSRGLSSFPARGSAESNHLIPSSQTQVSSAANNRVTLKPGLQAEAKGHHESAAKTCVPPSENKGSGGRLQNAPVTSQSGYGEKDFTSPKAPGPLPGNKGRRSAYPVRNSGMRSSFPASEASRTDPTGGYQRRPRRAIQRTEFRVRENVDRRQTSGFDSPNHLGPDDKLNSNARAMGTFARGGFRRGSSLTKPSRQIAESESIVTGPNSSQEIISESRAGRGAAKQSISRSLGTSDSGEGNLKRNIPEEDVDAPLQSGIVRVFKQPGIEAPSDEDDFIEVRSKRQMLNDRREQREKEIKAKSRVTKLQRKPRSSVQSTGMSTASSKISPSMGSQTSNNVRSGFSSFEGRGIVNKESSPGFPTIVSQPLPPIGTPAVNTDSQADTRSHTIKSLQTVPVPVISGSGKDLGPSLIFESKNKVLDNVQASVGAWGSAQIDQQVMALTQTQLDEAMKPGRFDTHVTSIGDHTISVSEPVLPSSSILTKEKSNSSSASPINSLLAGEKIQFGAVTSPTVLPPSSRIVSHGIGAPGPFRSDIKISQSHPKAENDRSLFFEKEKHPNESCALLEDREAEAAASAVAVAAISTDEIAGNRLGSVSVSDAKSFGGADIDGITGGLAVDQQSGSQSRPEESLSVSLPADLSVETPPISLWPPLPSPQNSSAPMLSHFQGAPPSHFPFYEMNHPMMGGPIFAFGPHEESGGTQSQSQKSTVAGPGHIGAWQHHSSVDSFYGPPAGFSGPFISPPGGIPGVQAPPPHMVVYNHYAPVGQFGQVGLSFMGATYIPSGKQPDWKHNPTSSGMGIGEGDMNAMNMVPGQRNPPNMPPPLQHLAPGSPLLPMASPLAMFDVSPFQNAPEISVQARWPHLPASALHSVPITLPQQQAEGAMPSQFGSHGHSVDQSLPPNRFSESRSSTPSDKSRGFPVVRDATVAQFANELGLVESSSSTISGPSTQRAISQGSPGNTLVNSGKADAIPKGSGNSGSNGQGANAFKPQHPHPKNSSAQHHQHQHQHQQHQQYNQSGGGYGYQRGTSQKNNSVGEWSHRRMGFHGRNQSLGADRNFPSMKMKQIYVAKQQTPSGPSSTIG